MSSSAETHFHIAQFGPVEREVVDLELGRSHHHNLIKCTAVAQNTTLQTILLSIFLEKSTVYSLNLFRVSKQLVELNVLSYRDIVFYFVGKPSSFARNQNIDYCRRCQF